MRIVGCGIFPLINNTSYRMFIPCRRYTPSITCKCLEEATGNYAVTLRRDTVGPKFFLVRHTRHNISQFLNRKEENVTTRRYPCMFREDIVVVVEGAAAALSETVAITSEPAECDDGVL